MEVIANFFCLMAIITGALWIFTETKYGKRWIRREFDGEMEDVEDTHFTFTEEQKERIKRIINKHYTEEGCDTCGHYMGCSGGGLLVLLVVTAMERKITCPIMIQENQTIRCSKKLRKSLMNKSTYETYSK